MKPDPVEQELRELAWRRPLKAAEQARLEEWLARHPEVRADWEADAALNAALSKLLEKPAPSNLAARVLAAIDRQEVSTPAGRRRNWLASLSWLPRVAVVAVLVGGGGFWYQQQRATRQAEALARLEQAGALAKLATATEASALPSVEALENFEVILRIHPAPLADTELLSMSKQLAEVKP
jgi:anti-sigma factor RsiW